jgi:hypothetical protein
MPIGECGGTCPPCASNQGCVGGSAASQARPTCLATCQSPADCAAGERCAQLSGEGANFYCASEAKPALCGANPRWSCTLSEASCDGATLLRPFTAATNQTCGYERVPCPSGCDAPLGAPAKCK